MNTARSREDMVLKRLAMVLKGHLTAEDLVGEEEKRLLGYAAALIDGYAPDAQSRLKTFIRTCRNSLKHDVSCGARDAVQARWGSPVHLDCQKLRKEITTYV